MGPVEPLNVSEIRGKLIGEVNASASRSVLMTRLIQTLRAVESRVAALGGRMTNNSQEIRMDWKMLRRTEFARLLASAMHAPPEAADHLKTLTELADTMDAELKAYQLDWGKLDSLQGDLEINVQILLARCLEEIEKDLSQIVNTTDIIQSKLLN